MKQPRAKLGVGHRKMGLPQPPQIEIKPSYYYLCSKCNKTVKQVYSSKKGYLCIKCNEKEKC